MLQNSFDPFSLFSMKQLVGNCLDFLTEGMRAATQTYVTTKNPLPIDGFPHESVAKWDLQMLIRYFLTAYDALVVFFNIKEMYLKTLLFEAKHFRNQWAHHKDFNIRDVYRICDTVQLVFDQLGMDKTSEIYQKINYFRIESCVKMAKQILEEQAALQQQQQTLLHSTAGSHIQIPQTQQQNNNNMMEISNDYGQGFTQQQHSNQNGSYGGGTAGLSELEIMMLKQQQQDCYGFKKF
jgi:hypothetical protein